MLKYPITYTDYNNVIRTEDFYFNLNKAEVMEMELGTTGGYTEMIRKIISAQDTPTLEHWREAWAELRRKVSRRQAPDEVQGDRGGFCTDGGLL